MATLITVDVVNATCSVSGYTPSFDLTWVSSNTQAGALYQISLYTGTTQQPLQTLIGTATKATANLSGSWVYAKQVPGGTGLTQYAPYWLTVQAVDSSGNIMGAPSDPLLAVFIAVPLVNVTTIGKSVVMQWSRTATQAYQVDGFQAQIIDANNATWKTAELPYPGLYTTASGNPAQSGSFVLDIPLELAEQPLQLQFYPYAQTAKAGQVSGVTAFAQGPVTTQSLYTVVPDILSAINVTGTPTQYALTIANSFGSNTIAPTFTASVWAGGAPVSGVTLSTPAISGSNVTATLTLPTSPATCANGAPLTLSLTQTDSGATPIGSGPASQPHQLLAQAPVVCAAQFTAPAIAGGAGTLALTLAYPPGQPQVGAASLTILDSGAHAAFGPSVVSGQQVQVLPTLSADTTCSVQLQGVLGPDMGPAGTSVSFPTSAPSLLTASYDGAVARATWLAPGGATPTGYSLIAVNGTAASLSVEVSGTDGAIIAPAGPSGLSLGVAAFIAQSVLGPTATVPLLTAAPVVSSVTANVNSGLMTVNWGSVQNADGYLVQLHQNGVPSGAAIAVTGTSYPFTAVLADDADYAVTVAATMQATIAGQTGKVAVTGPYGCARAMPTAIPVIISSDYDGVNAQVTWREVEGASAYLVSVIEQGSTGAALATATAAAGETSSRFTAAITDTTKVYLTVVQAQFGPDLGAPSATQPLFQPGYYLAPSSNGGSTAIYPATVVALPLQTSLANVAAQSATQTCYLPPLADSGTTIGTVTAAGPFSLAAYTGAGSTQYPFSLSIAGGASSEAWSFDGSAIRAQLQADYIQFLKNAESANVSPYGIIVIQQAIARLLPQTFAETLYYAYGYNTNATSGGSIDLRPGLTVRVAADPYQYVNNQTSGTADNAFVGGPSLDLDVSSYLSSGKYKLGFDAFFAQLVASQALSVTAPTFDQQTLSEQPVADAADLFFPLFNQAFYRIFVPSTLATPWQTGSNLPASNFAVAAATTFTNLSTASPVTGGTATLAYFGGRSVIRACVRITVDGAELVVPVGTTVGNILERMGRRPPSTSVPITGVELQRPLAPIVLNPQAGFDVGQSYKVRFDWSSLALYGFANDAFNLPVLHGDVLLSFAG